MWPAIVSREGLSIRGCECRLTLYLLPRLLEYYTTDNGQDLIPDVTVLEVIVLNLVHSEVEQP